MQHTYKLRNNAIIFHPLFDGLNDYKTYAYDINSDMLLKLQAPAYIILYQLHAKPGITVEQVIQDTQKIMTKHQKSISDTEIKKIIEYFTKVQIIQKG